MPPTMDEIKAQYAIWAEAFKQKKTGELHGDYDHGISSDTAE